MDKKKFWAFRNSSESKGELMLYGPISETTWWGDEVTPKQFDSDLHALGDISELDVRINSGGGDVFAAIAIGNMLKNHKAKINGYIDGIAASAATIIAAATDVLYIPPEGMMMYHDPLTGLKGMYNAKDLMKMVEVLNKVKDAIIASYVQKTGMEEKKLAKLMDEETWMTGAEAVEKKFADVLLTGQKVQATFQNGLYIMNNIAFDVAKFRNFPLQAPAAPPTSEPPAVPVANSSEPKTQKEEAPLKLEDLKNEHPELYNQVLELGVKAERERIQEIEDLGVNGHEDIIDAAKFTSGITAAQVAMEVIKADRKKGADYLNSRKRDVQNSGMDGVEGQDAAAKSSKEAQAGADVANMMDQRRGIK